MSPHANITREHAGNTWTFDAARGAWIPQWPVMGTEKHQLTRFEPARMAVVARKRAWFSSDGGVHATLTDAMDAEIDFWVAEDRRIALARDMHIRDIEAATDLRRECATLRAKLAKQQRRLSNAYGAIILLLGSIFTLVCAL